MQTRVSNFLVSCGTNILAGHCRTVFTAQQNPSLHRGVQALPHGTCLQRGFRSTSCSYASPEVQFGLDATNLMIHRRSLERKVDIAGFRIAGVSFEGRQDHVKFLEREQPLMLIREPWNEYDPLAVRIYTLRGQDLGFVPRESNKPHVHEWNVARVQSVGIAASGLFGVHLRSRPSLMSISAQRLPRAAAGVVQQLASASGWAEFASETMRLADNACEVTGMPAAEGKPLHVVPVWRYDSSALVVKMVRGAAVCASVRDAMYSVPSVLVFDDQRAPTDAQVVMLDVNGWNEDDLMQYSLFLEDLQARMDGERWDVDVSVVPGAQ